MVDASILYSILEDTSTGVGRLGRWSGIGKAITCGGPERKWVNKCPRALYNSRVNFNMLGRVLLLLATMAISHGVYVYFKTYVYLMFRQPPFQLMNVSLPARNALSEPYPNTRFFPSKGSWASWRPNPSRCNLHRNLQYCFPTKIFLDCSGMLYWPATGNSWCKLECPTVERNYLGEWNAKAVRYSLND